jgi:hypothetical protein
MNFFASSTFLYISVVGASTGVLNFFVVSEASPVGLKAGAYSLFSKQIIIVRDGNSFCYVGMSRNGVTVSSLYRDKKNPKAYKIHKFKTDIVQKSNDIILFGNGDYTYDPNYDLSVLKYIPESKACLKSKQPYGKTIENRFR